VIKRTQVIPKPFVAVGDPVRPVLGRAVKLTIFATVLFTAFAFFDKELPWLYIHEPWRDDPYDTFVSFAIIFNPLVLIVTLVRIPLLKKNRELPARRVRDLVRGCRLMISIAMITLIADWVSVALRANRPIWTSGTAVSIGLLLITTCGVCLPAFDLIQLSVKNHSSEFDWLPGDGLGDMILVMRRLTTYCGWVGQVGGVLVDWTDRHIVRRMRDRPLLGAMTISATVGVAVASSQAIGEGIPGWPVVAFFFSVVACGMYAFIVISGWQLGLVSSAKSASGLKRQIIDATVASAAIVPLCVAFRNPLGRFLGIGVDNLKQVMALLIGAAGAMIIVVFLGEALTGMHLHEDPNC
jgi:predicted secreted protein